MTANLEQQIRSTVSVARVATDHDAWLAERFRLAGILWAAVGLYLPNGTTSFAEMSELARRACTGEITSDGVIHQIDAHMRAREVQHA